MAVFINLVLVICDDKGYWLCSVQGVFTSFKLIIQPGYSQLCIRLLTEGAN